MNLDFKNSNTTYSTHGFHTYPAKMIPQVANALIAEFGSKSKILFDPYCGSGTSLVEANLKGINAIGTDLNPLARLIASVKTTPLELQTLDLHLKDFYDYLFKFRFGFQSEKDSIIVPQFQKIDFWFSRSVKLDLSIISNYIDKIENSEIKNFFHLALSQTIRECSWTRKNEFKLYKMSSDYIKNFKPDAISTFEKILGRNRTGLEHFILNKMKRINSKVFDFNTSEGIPQKIIGEKNIDLVVTSPPYGDSATTVAYGQFSALANQWLGFLENGRSLDALLMGGKKVQEKIKFESKALNLTINKVLNKDEKRAFEVIAFYKDYETSIRNVSQTIKDNGYACYVVSNRNVKAVTLPTDVITRDFFESNGFKHIATYKRRISNKRMPRRNSAVGKVGKKTTLMNTEHIVIMQKIK
jgi:site-specific DNA-methyltransferase (cytosine-N4-specific)